MAERETSDVIALSAVLSANIASEPGTAKPRVDASLEGLRKRISYFVGIRLLTLILLTMIGVSNTFGLVDHSFELLEWLVIVGLLVGYVQTIVSSWYLRRGDHTLAQLQRSSRVQSLVDTVLATATVTLSGGVYSGFVFLFMIAVLGAAMMGDRRQIVVVAGVSVLLYYGVTFAQLSGLLGGLSGNGEANDAKELWLILIRNTAAIAGVGFLSGLLNNQLLSSVLEAGGLRTINENILRSLSSGLLAIDQVGKVLLANPTAVTLLGRRGSIDRLDCEQLLPGVSAHLDDSGGIRNRFELTVTRPDDNRRVNLGLSCSPLLDEHGRFLGNIINFQDVTDLREMERILRRNERLAALGTLAASIAHEVRNPLAAISGCAELLEPDVNDEDKRLLKVIRSETARLADIVTDLLDYARPRPLERSKIELGRALSELGDSFRADPSNAEIDLRVNVPEHAVQVELDISQLTQVLWNLVRNGAEAMDGNGQMDLDLREVGDRVLLFVRDQGGGIDAKHLERIFEPFFSTKSGGTGIGLSIVHRIIDEHGGKIDVKSTRGKGTVFVIDLPKIAPP